MASLGEHLAQASTMDPIVLQADARRLRGEEMRQMAKALKRWIGDPVAGLARRDRPGAIDRRISGLQPTCSSKAALRQCG